MVHNMVTLDLRFEICDCVRLLADVRILVNTFGFPIRQPADAGLIRLLCHRLKLPDVCDVRNEDTIAEGAVNNMRGHATPGLRMRPCS